MSWESQMVGWVVWEKGGTGWGKAGAKRDRVGWDVAGKEASKPPRTRHPAIPAIPSHPSTAGCLFATQPDQEGSWEASSARAVVF